MTTVDQRVVQMKFDNAAFERGVAQTLRSLETLNKSLQLQGATKGLTDVAAASQKINLKNVESNVQSLADRFKGMAVVATTALATVAHQATVSGGQLIKSLTLDPILKGFREYEINMNSIQTVLANTAHAGTTLEQVNATLATLNEYSDQTIYNFSEMAKNIGTFTAAGVDLDTAANAIKGIANLAAISGSNSQQASTAMYQLSQAISAGKVSLEDWNSVVNAGMGGKVFQDALMETARVHGVAIDSMVEDAGSFRLSLEKGWLTGEILTETLSKFTGDLTAAQLKTMGYNEEQIAGILKMAKVAQGAATEVKTISQLISTLQEAAGSGWAQTWQLLFGDFEEARTLFTNVSNVLGGFITASSEARNNVLKDWDELGGRTVIIEAISNAFNALIAVLKPIGQAFREIFPAVTAQQLYDMSVAVRNFTEGLMISSESANNLRRTFAGVFAILGIGWEIVKQITLTLLRLVGVATDGSGGFLEFTGGIGDFVVALHDALVEGRGIAKFFEGLGKVLAVPIRLIKMLAGYLSSLFEDLDADAATQAVDGFAKKLEPLGRMGEIISTVWTKTISVLTNFWSSLSDIGRRISDFFGGFGDSVASALQGLDFGDVFAGINTGLFAGLVLMLRNLIGGGGVGGILENIGDAFDNLTGALGAMQNTLRAATLLQIAAAVGILAIAMNTLSKIDAAGLARASAAITVMFTQLLGSLLIFEKFSGFVGFAKMPFVAASMILMAVAINVLASAMAKMAELDWNGIAKGLTGTTVLLTALVLVGKFMPNPAGMITTALGLVILAGAIKVLVSAVTDLSGLSWEELAKGLVGVGVLLGSLGLFTKFAAVGKGAVFQGAGLILLAAGIKILASAVEDLSGMSWEEIARGLVALAGGLAIITAALMLIPPTAPLGAAAVLIVALSLGMVGESLEELGQLSWGAIGKGLTALLGALAIITAAVTIIPPTAPLGAAAILIVALSLGQVADVLAQLGAMDWTSIGKSLAALAGAMLIIVVGVSAMTGALAGAAAMLIVAASLAILAPVLLAFGQMSWEEMGKGLLMLAGAFIVLGVAGALLTPVVPTLIGLGIAVSLLGIGFALAGVGALAFATGLTALAVAGAAGTAAIVGIVGGLIGLLPLVAEQIGLALVVFAEVIAEAGPAITKAIVAVLGAVIDAIVELTPKIIKAMLKLLDILLVEVEKYTPKMTDTGIKIITGFLNGIAKNMDRITTTATNVIVSFINGISKNLPRIIQAGVNLIVNFVNGMAKSIRSNSAAMGNAGFNLATAIIEGMVRGLGAGLGRIASAAMSVARSALDSAMAVLGVNSPSKEFEKIGNYVNDGFRKGLDGNKGQVDESFNSLRSQLSTMMKESGKDVDALEAKLSKLQKARHKDNAEIRRTKEALRQAYLEQRASTNAYTMLTKKLNDEKDALGRLANEYDVVSEKIKAAQETLANAIKTRDDYNKQVADQYSDLPSATGETNLADYLEDLKKQIADTKSFANAIQKLRNLGLNDEMYKDLIAQGPQALPFVYELLEGGQTSVDEINKLSQELDNVGGSFGDTASSQLYQAAVDSAAGLVKGLQDQQAAIEKEMDKIADYMVKSIKKALGIKSPSKVFQELGAYSAQGLQKGLTDSAPMVGKAAEGVADQAVDSLRTTLSKMTDITLGEIDLNPKIRPVLDLTDVRKNAGQIGSILPGTVLSVEDSYSTAVGVSDLVRRNQNFGGVDADESPRGNVIFNQYNSSPKELSDAEIYRQTKNQLSRARGALANV